MCVCVKSAFVTTSMARYTKDTTQKYNRDIIINSLTIYLQQFDNDYITIHKMVTITQAFALSVNQSPKTVINIMASSLLHHANQLVVRYLQKTYHTAYVSLITLEL